MRTCALLTILLVSIHAVSCATAPAGGVSQSDIAAIVTAANQGEIDQGQAAAARATLNEVRAFAQMMIADHTTALNRGSGVFARAGIAPTENEISRSLAENSRRTIESLNSYAGAAFDRQYMQRQIDLHQWLLTNLDTMLIPSARSGDVRSLLRSQRDSVAAHLERARQILKGIG